VRGRKKRAAVTSWSWLLTLVPGRWRLWLGPIPRRPPPLDVGKLMAKYAHGEVGYFDAAGRALPGFLLGHLANLAMTSPAFHKL
jgi:hypothetical protein